VRTGQVEAGGQERQGGDLAGTADLRYREIGDDGGGTLGERGGGDGAVAGAEVDADDVAGGRGHRCDRRGNTKYTKEWGLSG